MPKKRWSLVVVCAGAALWGGLTAASVFTGSPAIAQQTQTAPVQTEWEYQRVVLGDLYAYTGSKDRFRREFDAISKDGWELIQVNELSSSSDKIATYWRRPKSLSTSAY